MARIVDNEGSAARDHLANERTLLAWVRTSLGLIGLGVILAQLVEKEGLVAEFAGVTLIAYGAIAQLYALGRYMRVARLLEQGRFPVARGGPAVLAIVALFVAGGAIVLVFW